LIVHHYRIHPCKEKCCRRQRNPCYADREESTKYEHIRPRSEVARATGPEDQLNLPATAGGTSLSKRALLRLQASAVRGDFSVTHIRDSHRRIREAAVGTVSPVPQLPPHPLRCPGVPGLATFSSGVSRKQTPSAMGLNRNQKELECHVLLQVAVKKPCRLKEGHV